MDVQRDGLFYVTRGWCAGVESFLLDQEFLAGPTEYQPVWEALANVIGKGIRDRPIDRVFIDSGYRPGDVHRRPDHAVYTFCRGMPGLAYPTKGQDTMDTPYRFRNIDYSVGGAVVKGGVRLFHVNTDYFKRWLHARIRWPEDQAGGWYLHQETPDSYCRHMVAEEQVLTRQGKPKWVVVNRENHYLDCEVNAVCAAFTLNIQQLAPVEAPAKNPEPDPQNNPPALQNPSGNPYARRTL